MTDKNTMNDKDELFRYLERWVRLSTRFTLKSINVEKNEKSVWKDSK